MGQLNKKRGRMGDVMKTPLSQVVGALRLCNPPAFRRSLDIVARHWQKKTSRFSLLFDEYPDRTHTPPFFIFLGCKVKKKSGHGCILSRQNVVVLIFFIEVTAAPMGLGQSLLFSMSR
jgi:hypothetical protein